MKKFNSDLDVNPSFNSVTELTNTTFNPSNYVENRMATEQQISELYNRIVEQEDRRDKCCRDIIVWEAHTQIVRMNTANIDSANHINGGGVVISTFDENVNIGTMRRGLMYTITFPIKWDSSLYVPRNAAATSSTALCGHVPTSESANKYWTIVNYRIIEDNSIQIGNCQSTTTNYAKFWLDLGRSLVTDTSKNNNPEGHRINPGGNWGKFTYNMLSDGTVTIKDNRQNINFNVIRYYTQWILRECADGSIIPDPE